MDLDKYKQIIDESYSILQKEQHEDERRHRRTALKDQSNQKNSQEKHTSSKQDSKKSCLRKTTYGIILYSKYSFVPPSKTGDLGICFVQFNLATFKQIPLTLSIDSDQGHF